MHCFRDFFIITHSYLEARTKCQECIKKCIIEGNVHNLKPIFFCTFEGYVQNVKLVGFLYILTLYSIITPLKYHIFENITKRDTLLF